MIALDVRPQNRIKDLVVGERLIVALVGFEFGRWRLGEHSGRDDRSTGNLIAPGAQVVDGEFPDIANDGECAGGVAVERGVADRCLGLVAGREHEPTVLIGHRHQDHAANTRLQVLISEIADVDLLIGEVWGEHPGEGLVSRFDRDGVGGDTEIRCELFGVGDRVVARVARGHQHAEDVFGAERFRRDGGDDRGIDTTGEPETGLGEPGLAHIVASAEDEGFPDLGEFVERLCDGGSHRGPDVGDRRRDGDRRIAVVRGPAIRHGDVEDDERLDKARTSSGDDRPVSRRRNGE